MQLILISVISILLIGCGSEGLEIEPSEIPAWFNQHRPELELISDEFESNPCLRRVELNSMQYIKQHCPMNDSLEKSISKVQAQLKKLKLILAVSDKNPNQKTAFIEGLNILLSRHGIAVSGGGIGLYKPKTQTDWHVEAQKCGEVIPLTSDGWYLRYMSSEANCSSNPSFKRDA